MPEGQPTRRQSSWFWRRSLTFIMTAFCMSLLTWITWSGTDDALRRLIANGLLWLLFGMAGIYIAGATTDDLITFARTIRGLPDKGSNARST